MSLFQFHRDGIDLWIELPTDVTKDIDISEPEPGVMEIRQVEAKRIGRRRFVIGGAIPRERVT